MTFLRSILEVLDKINITKTNMLSRTSKMLLKNVMKPNSMRAFSAGHLLVPISVKEDLPAEMKEGFPLTNAYFNELESSFETFNE